MDFLTGKTYPIITSPTWNVIDNSKISEFLGCRRKFFFKYVMGWRPEKQSVHLAFGKAFHFAMEWLLLNGFTLDNGDRAFRIFLDAFRSEWSEETDSENSPKNPSRFLAALTDMIGKYRDFHEEWEVLATEKGGLVEIAPGMDITYRIDALLRRRRTGKLAILDHKSDTFNISNWRDKFTLNNQVSAYVYAANQLELAKGKQVDEMLINRMLLKKGLKDDSKVEKHQVEMESFTRASFQLECWRSTMVRVMREMEVEFERLSTESANSPVMDSFYQNTESCLNYNKRCIYHGFCTFVGNPLGMETPEGFKQEWWNPLTEGATNV